MDRKRPALTSAEEGKLGQIAQFALALASKAVVGKVGLLAQRLSFL